jgi:hypothetical protein
MRTMKMMLMIMFSLYTVSPIWPQNPSISEVEVKKLAERAGWQIDSKAATSFNHCPVAQGAQTLSAARLLNYFTAKAATKDVATLGSRKLTSADLGDFSCSYLARDTGFTQAALKTDRPITLRNIESLGIRVEFTGAPTLSGGQGFLLPKLNSPDGKITLAAAIDGKGHQAFWTGTSASSAVVFHSAQSSAGCEVYVDSEPDQATVYFNEKQWEEATNTSSIRDPGTINVRLSKQGFKDWSNEHSCKAGDSWHIDAKLQAK